MDDACKTKKINRINVKSFGIPDLQEIPKEEQDDKSMDGKKNIIQKQERSLSKSLTIKKLIQMVGWYFVPGTYIIFILAYSTCFSVYF